MSSVVRIHNKINYVSVLYTDKAALGLSNIILKGVQSGLLALVERALTVVKEHSHSSQSDGNLLLDFLAQSSSPKVSLSSCLLVGSLSLPMCFFH